MIATDRVQTEQIFHDLQAEDRAADLREDTDLRFSDDWYLDHETWIRPAFARLGNVAGRNVLDLGCGHGMAAVVLARRGATVAAVDLSAGYLREAGRRAAANGVSVTFTQADAERLPFDDNSFDAIWGNAILHHLDLSAAARELRRVLRPGGVAVCCEPWGGNPMLGLARHCVPYPGKHRTPDERPLRPRDLPLLREVFPAMTVEGFQLLAMVRRVLGRRRVVEWLDRYDVALLRRWPSLWRFCRYVVLTLPTA